MPVPTRDDFLLDPDLVFLNHGSFGAVPRRVHEASEALRLEMERNPVEWLGRRADDLLLAARRRLAEFTGASPDDLVFFPNPTTAINMVVRSLRLPAGSEVLTTDHEYGAMVRTWQKWCGEHHIGYRPVTLPDPLTTPEEVVEVIWSAVGEHTKVLFLSHVTSATAVRLPVEELCRRARDAGILTIIDGAHVPNHLALDLISLGADVYTGALHKWLCAPKGASFLHATSAVQEWLQPLVVSWGWESDQPSSSRFIDHHQWQGTRDLTPFLAVPSAIDFVESYNWATVRAEAHRRVVDARDRVGAITGLAALAPDGHRWLGQMAAIRLPDGVDVQRLQTRLREQHRIEVPCHRWNGHALMRVSATAHTTDDDIDALVAALPAALRAEGTPPS